MGQKICNMVRLLFLLLQKNASKTKLIFHLHRLITRSKILRKALNHLMLRRHFSCRLPCRDDAVHSPACRRDYEFSCSNSPAGDHLPAFATKGLYPYSRYRAPPLGDLSELEASPLVGPVGRLVRVTDSPFPIKDVADVDCHVDKAAEEFIERFYRQLRSQKWTPSPTPGREGVYRYG